MKKKFKSLWKIDISYDDDSGDTASATFMVVARTIDKAISIARKNFGNVDVEIVSVEKTNCNLLY